MSSLTRRMQKDEAHKKAKFGREDSERSSDVSSPGYGSVVDVAAQILAGGSSGVMGPDAQGLLKWSVEEYMTRNCSPPAPHSAAMAPVVNREEEFFVACCQGDAVTATRLLNEGVEPTYVDRFTY